MVFQKKKHRKIHAITTAAETLIVAKTHINIKKWSRGHYTGIFCFINEFLSFNYSICVCHLANRIATEKLQFEFFGNPRLITPHITRWHVPECFKDDNEGQWKTGKFDPPLSPKPLNQWPLNLAWWWCRGHLPLCKISLGLLSDKGFMLPDPARPATPAPVRTKWLG